MRAGIELAKRAVELKPSLKVVYSPELSVTDERAVEIRFGFHDITLPLLQ